MEQKKRRNQQPTGFDVGLLPPQAVEFEEAVLGAILQERDAITKAEKICADDFYRTENKTLFNALLSLKSENKPIDLLTVTQRLKKTGELDSVGGALYLTKLMAKVGSSANIEYHVEIIKQKSIARKLINFSYELQRMSYDESNDIADVTEFAEKLFTEVSTNTNSSEYANMVDSIHETLGYYAEIQRNRESGINNFIPTGLYNLNRVLNGGWCSPDLIVLGGRPGMGKTEFAVHFAKNAAIDGEVLFISIEMTKKQLITRMLLENEMIDFYRLKTGQLTHQEWEIINNKSGELSRLNLNIADDHNVRYLSEIKTLARKLHRKGQLKLLIIDYLQLIKTNMKFHTRDLEIGYITGELKNLAKELNVPVILLAQLNRPLKGTKVQAPKLEDLRESGNIEQDADIVIFIHRTVYYDANAVDEENNSLKNKGGLIIAKHREGVKDEIVMFQHDDRFKKIWDDRDAF